MQEIPTALKINLYHFHPSDGEAKLHGRLNSDIYRALFAKGT